MTEVAPNRIDPRLDAALSVLARRWTLQIVALLLSAPRRFKDLRDALPKISANVLTGRLEEMIDLGLVRRRRLPRPADVQVYELTQAGAALKPVVDALVRWAVDRTAATAIQSVARM